MTDTTETVPAPGGQARGTREFVAAQVSRIQAQYVGTDQTSWSRAALARLRRSVGRPPGADLDVLDLLINPDAPDPRGEAPTRDELAIAAALGLYAVHQQSLRTPAHIAGVRFGSVVGRIRFREGAEVPGVLRRFQAFGTADQWSELIHHARGLVQLLRDRGVGFDYGDFAEDLVRYLDPARRDAARLRWGRDFYRVLDTTTAHAAEEK